MNPENASAFLHRGLARFALKDARGAILDYNTALKLQSSLEQGYADRGEAKCTLKDYAGGVADYDAALNLNTNDKKVYYLRGMAKILYLKDKSGCYDLSQAGLLGMKEAFDMIKKYCKD